MLNLLYDYILSVSLKEPEVLKRLREETREYPMYYMQIAPEQGQFLAFLIELTGANSTIEIGVFTGYSSLWTALALPAKGKITACEICEKWASVARRYWSEAGVSEKIDLHMAPALETLDKLLNGGQKDSFDFAFIDADKENAEKYYERCLKLVRPGGLIVIDDVLWSGLLTDPQKDDGETKGMRNFNEKLYKDERIKMCLVPVGNGMTLAIKR